MSTKTHLFESGADTVGAAGFWGLKGQSSGAEDLAAREKQKKEKNKVPKVKLPKPVKEKKEKVDKLFFDLGDGQEKTKKPVEPTAPTIVFHPSYYGLSNLCFPNQ